MQIEAALAQEFARLAAAACRILIVSHRRPDGDAVGSVLALGLTLQAAGKEVQMVLEDGVPASLRYLTGSEEVSRTPQGAFDLVCVVDCSDLPRTGHVLNDIGLPQVNIDHHLTNLRFAALNIVDDTAVATAEVLYHLFVQAGFSVPAGAAEALLTGLITDTIGFRTSNITPEAMRLAADLMEQGADLPELYRRALSNHSYEALRLWGQGLTKLEKDGRLVYTILTAQDRRLAGYAGRDDADLINLLSAVEGVHIAIVLVEQSPTLVKVSWRASPGIDVSQIALSFGGGGHAAAAGAEITGNLQDIVGLVLERTRPLLTH